MASHKQRVWLEEYLKCWNATEAARRAQYANPKLAGHRNKQTFENEIAERLQEKHMGAEEALARMAAWARADLGPFMNYDGEVDIASLKDAGMTHIIHSIKRNERSGTNQNGTVWETVHTELKTHDAKDALKTIMQHLGLLDGKPGTDEQPFVVKVLRGVGSDDL